MLSNCKILQSFHLFNQTCPIDPIHLKKLFQPQFFLNFEEKKSFLNFADQFQTVKSFKHTKVQCYTDFECQCRF
jgi:hypothetical protein